MSLNMFLEIKTNINKKESIHTICWKNAYPIHVWFTDRLNRQGECVENTLYELAISDLNDLVNGCIECAYMIEHSNYPVKYDNMLLDTPDIFILDVDCGNYGEQFIYTIKKLMNCELEKDSIITYRFHY